MNDRNLVSSRDDDLAKTSALRADLLDDTMTEHETRFEILEREAELIVKGLDIPPCPAILAKFTQEFHAPNPDTRKLAALIGTDIGLSATMLKTVNSPFYGLTNKAKSVEQALAILGLRASANLISGLLLRHAFPAESNATLEQFWERSTRIAGLAAAIATRLKGLECDQAHTYVLFRDCGMLVMLRKYPQYAEMMTLGSVTPGAHLCSVENTRFKFNHARVSFALVRGWSLPDPLCKAILYHHELPLLEQNSVDLEDANRKLVAFGLLAEQIASLHLNMGICPDWIVGERFVLDTLNIEPEEIVELSQDLLAASG